MDIPEARGRSVFAKTAGVMALLTVGGLCIAQGIESRQLHREFQSLSQPPNAAPLSPLEATREFRNQDEPVERHSAAEGETLLQQLEANPSGERLIQVYTVLCSWSIQSRDEAEASHTREAWLTQFSEKFRSKVHDLHNRAKLARNWKEGLVHYAEAHRILDHFTKCDDHSVLAEVQGLLTSHADVLSEMQILRKQRYNYWAVTRVEAAVQGFHENSSWLHPLDENPLLMDSLVRNIAEVETSLLDPPTLSGYQYVIQLTKENISEAQGVEVVKRLNDPKVTKKSLEDF